MRPARHPDAGLTLVELMVTLIVASMVASSTYMFFAGQQRVYDTQTKLVNVQQNLWSAMETLVRFTRAAGSGMADCVRPDSDGTGTADWGAPSPGTVITPPPIPTFTANTTPIPNAGLRAYHATYFPTAPNVGRIPPFWIQDGGIDAPDRLRVAFGNASLGAYSDAPLAVANVVDATSVINLTTPQTNIFRPLDFIVLLDTSVAPPTLERGCTLMQVTAIPSLTVLTHGSSSPWNPATSLTGAYIPTPYAFGANVGAVRHFGQLNWIEFWINSDPALPAPRLMMDRYDGGGTGQVLAEGIEDLQVAFACDGLGAGNTLDGTLVEGAVGSRSTDEWVYNGPGETPPPGCGRPTAIRITLVVRSTTADDLLNDATLGNARPAVENRVAGAVDAFRHRVQETVVFPRN